MKSAAFSHSIAPSQMPGAMAPAALLWILLACALPAAAEGGSGLLSPGEGSLEFRMSARTGAISFLKPQTILRATSSDGSERFEAKITGSDLIVIRDTRPCLRLSARVQNAIVQGVAQDVSLRWHGASAAVRVGSRGEQALEPAGIDDLPRFVPMAPALGSSDVDVAGAVLNRMPVLAESPADRQFKQQAKCFNPGAYAASPAQDAYRGIDLRGLTTAGQRDQLARWIAAMTPEMASVVRSVSVTSDGAQTWQGLSVSGSQGAMLLRPQAVAEARVFFHEGAHLLDGSHGWSDSQDWGTRFMGLPPGARSFSPGAVGHMDASAPGEQLADFVGRAREEGLGLAKSWICAHDASCQAKLSFLAERGYLADADAKRIAAMRTRLATAGGDAAKPEPGNRPRGAAPTPNPNYPTETIVPASDSGLVDVVLSARYFRPIDIYYNGGTTVHPTWRGCKAEDVMNRLTRKRPTEIVSEPPLKGVSRSYGYFEFGTKKNRRHYFALDELADGSIQMLLDMKGNGRLDESPARPSMGSFKPGEKAYATALEFPWAEVMEGTPFEGVFKLWFMSNPFEWSIAGFSKSSRTQLLGSIRLGSEAYDLIVADGAESDNDGDLTNDGVCLRKPGQKATCYKDAEARKGVLIDGKRYAFNVRYP